MQILHNYEYGKTLEYVDAKLEVKPDNSGNVQLTRTEAGLKAEVVLPPEFDPSTLETKIQEAKDAATAAQATATGADTKATTAGEKNTAQDAEIEALKQKVATLESREDIKLAGASLDDATNELKLTLSDGFEIKAPLAKFVDAPKTAEQYWTEIKALPTFKADLLAVLKGEVVQDFAGVTKGYLLPEA